MAVQEGVTSVRVSWNLPSILGETAGYIISYTDSSSGNVTVSGGHTDNHLLTGLHRAGYYTISILATSQHYFSCSAAVTIKLCKTSIGS